MSILLFLICICIVFGVPLFLIALDERSFTEIIDSKKFIASGDKFYYRRFAFDPIRVKNKKFLIKWFCFTYVEYDRTHLGIRIPVYLCKDAEKAISKEEFWIAIL